MTERKITASVVLYNTPKSQAEFFFNIGRKPCFGIRWIFTGDRKNSLTAP